MTQTPSPADVLACPMVPNRNDADAATIGDYLIALLTTLWKEQDEFSGKRPFGNSDWSADLELALVQAGMVPGVVDEEGPWLNEVDQPAADEAILGAIRSLSRLWEPTETAAAPDPHREGSPDTTLLLQPVGAKPMRLPGGVATVLQGGALHVAIPNGVVVTERVFAPQAWESFLYLPTELADQANPDETETQP